MSGRPISERASSPIFTPPAEPGLLHGFALAAAEGIAHITAAARSRGLDSGMLDAARAVMDRAVDEGRGEEGLARLAVMWARRERCY